MERAFQAYGEPLDNTTSFQYLGRVLTAAVENWMAVVGNLRKARKSWVRMTRILSREGADPKVLEVFFKVVVQAVLLFRADMWVLNPRMEQDLSNFRHRVTRWLTGTKPRRRGEGRC